jgi:hypothetical protein
MDYVLQHQITEEDIDFLNITSIKFEIFNSHGLAPETDITDSGWCDMATGARIISPIDRVAFLDVSPEELTFLNLKYYNRLKPLHNGFKKIYKYKTDII